ncbi:hypothetical protein AB205_0150580 [Aquarana catesbeiana]|uniref:Uncharacterized protein n=1 Tax=Aquarana catesbeiana TaxID=8400 RepID=A0A2G9RZP9_AQUCT|nr:hypothetical protein AB205_0150580 [Aquarana catesbeiana]
MEQEIIQQHSACTAELWNISSLLCTMKQTSEGKKPYAQRLVSIVLLWLHLRLVFFKLLVSMTSGQCILAKNIHFFFSSSI